MINNKKLFTLILSGSILLPSFLHINVFADSVTMVTIGESLNDKQKNQILNYFGVSENEVDIKIITNQDERKYLEGILPDEQIGHKTYSCAYIQPTKKGSGIHVKTANLNYVTPQMIKAAITSLGLGENSEISDMNIIGASVIPVSGTGFLTGVLTSLEDMGVTIDEEKKEIANEELIITGTLGEDIGKDKATGVINDIKTEIIKNNTKDTVQIAETINNVTNNYNLSLTVKQEQDIQALMEKIAEQDYNYNEIKDSLKDIKNSINETLEQLGEKVNNSNFFEKVGLWFEGIGDWFKGLFTKEEDSILNNTNDQALGKNVISTSTEDTTPADVQANEQPAKEENFFQKIWNWFKGLFTKEEDTTVNSDEAQLDNNTEVLEDIDSEIEEMDNIEPETTEELELETDSEEVDHIDSEIESEENSSIDGVDDITDNTQVDIDNNPLETSEVDEAVAN